MKRLLLGVIVVASVLLATNARAQNADDTDPNITPPTTPGTPATPSIPINPRPPRADDASLVDRLGRNPLSDSLWGIRTYQSWQAFEAANPPLTGFDATCIDTSGGNAPTTPASCAPTTTGIVATNAPDTCRSCFEHATRQLDGMRLNLERLRCTYAAQSRYVTAALSFGDTASGIHAVTGLAWQNARAGIVAEFENFKHAYDVKYGQMLPNLRSALDALGACEDQFFQEHNWYDRFGFMYYTFMADRYKRPN